MNSNQHYAAYRAELTRFLIIVNLDDEQPLWLQPEPVVLKDNTTPALASARA